jgi:preprotein translocase subunit SecE
MAKHQGIVQSAMRRRTPLRTAVAGPGAAVETRRKPPFNPVRFIGEVRAEARKVTWTSWKETWITSVMVGIMVILTALFFFGVDWILGIGVGGLLRLANAG